MQAHLSDLEKQNIVSQLEGKKLNQFEIAVILEAKTRVESIINGLKKIEKKVKKTKQSRKAIKVMEDFVKCNVTSPAISKKYQAVMELLAQYGKKEDV